MKSEREIIYDILEANGLGLDRFAPVSEESIKILQEYGSECTRSGYAQGYEQGLDDGVGYYYD